MSKKILIISAAVLAAILFFYVSVFGNTYTFPYPFQGDFNRDELTVNYGEPGIIECTDISYSDGFIYVTVNGLSRGNTHLEILSEQNSIYEVFYVHGFNIITHGSYIGDFNGTILLEAEILAFILLLILYYAVKIRKIVKERHYTYGVINMLGTVLFLVITLILLSVFFLNPEMRKLYNFIAAVSGSFSILSIVLFPIVMVFSLYLIVSNIVLIKNEGRSPTNFLSIGLGVLLIAGTVVSQYIYYWFSGITDVHFAPIGHLVTAIEGACFAVLGYVECLVFATVICINFAGRHKPQYDKDFVIILGAGLKKDGTLTPLLKGRVDKAIAFAKMQETATGKKITFVPSGGQGSDEVIAEADAMKNYLLCQGISEDMIIVENKSTSTIENMKFSKKLIDEKNRNGKIIFSTTNYHVLRSGVIAESQGMKSEGIGSKTKWYFYINALIRELVANLNTQRKKHIINITVIILVICLSALISYFLM